MAVARKCDVCGKLFEMRRKQGLLIRDYIDIGTLTDNHNWLSHDDLDLCPECMGHVMKTLYSLGLKEEDEDE